MRPLPLNFGVYLLKDPHNLLAYLLHTKRCGMPAYLIDARKLHHFDVEVPHPFPCEVHIEDTDYASTMTSEPFSSR